MKKIIMISLMLISLGILLVNAQELARYEFDEIEVVYAAEFIAKPISVNPDNWLVQIAGGVNKDIKVLYGIVELKKNGKTEITEEFIRVEGEGGFERFLLNSWSSYIENQLKFPISGESLYEVDMPTLKEAGDPNKKIRIDIKFSGDTQSFFWSAKKIVDANVVKDFTPPINSVSLYTRFKEGQRYAILLSTPEAGGKDKQYTSVLPQTVGKEQVIKEGETCDVASNNQLSMCFNYCSSIDESWAATCDGNVCGCVRPLGEMSQSSESNDVSVTQAISAQTQKTGMKEGNSCDPEAASGGIVDCLNYCSSIGINQATCNDGTCKCVEIDEAPQLAPNQDKG